MKYGFFDMDKNEYVIERVDCPVSWTNYLGLEKTCAVVNQTAGGYMFHQSPEYHRITRFRPNAVPMDRPGFYVYIRDDDTGEYWSASWQPVGKDLANAKYRCRHGLSYSVYECDYQDIESSQTVFIPLGDETLLNSVKIANKCEKTRNLSVFSYVEFSYHHILMDNQNFQMSLYASGSRYENGIIEYDLFYEEGAFQFFAANFAPDSYDCVRDKFIGLYHTETNPIAVENGECSGSSQLTGNHCGALHKRIRLAPGEQADLLFMLGEGGYEQGRKIRDKYSSMDVVVPDAVEYSVEDRVAVARDAVEQDEVELCVENRDAVECSIEDRVAVDQDTIERGIVDRDAVERGIIGQDAVDQALEEIAGFWNKKRNVLQINTPSEGMNAMINTWTLYQAEINVMFSRFASFIEVGGRTGLGYRDTAQDAMCVPHSNPEKCKSRIIELLKGLTSFGYGLHLFQPEWFEENKKSQGFKSPTVVPTPDKDSIIHGIKDACSDDALWLVTAIAEYIRETGEYEFADLELSYADQGSGSVYDHMKRILDFSTKQVGESGICKGLRADWNDCLNLGGGESAMVSFLHHWALKNFISLAGYLGRNEDAARYGAIAENIRENCEKVLWDGKWYIRGITKNGEKIGTQKSEEGKVHLESNAWAVLSGVAPKERGIECMDSVDQWLYTQYGLMLVAPSYTVPDDDIGFVTRVYPGVKENGAVFSHSNPWAWAAETCLGRGDRAMKFFDALCPYYQNDIAEIRHAEPYSYCQFVMGKDHSLHGKANHPFMTGSAGWAYYAATKYILGIAPSFDELRIDPCIPKSWSSFEVTRRWRGAVYNIRVKNPNGVEKGVAETWLNGKKIGGGVPVQPAGSENDVEIIMG